MMRSLRPWISAGVALTGAGLIALTPVTPALPNVQQRAVELVADPFPLVGWDDLFTNTEANWNALAEMFNQTTNLFTLPSDMLQNGLTTVGTDLLEFKELWDPFADPVINPLSLVTLLLTSVSSLLYAPNAAIEGAVGVFDDMEQSLANLDFAGFWNELVDAPSTIANAFLNGYPVAATAADSSLGTDYTLNAPSSDPLTPEFGLLTNPDVATGSAPGDVPLETGTLASWLQSEQTLADELQTLTGAPPAPVDAPITEGPNSVTLGVDFQNIWNDTGIPSSFSLNLGFTSVCLGIFDDSCGGDAYNFSLDLPQSASYTFDFPGISLPGATVPAYIYDLAQNASALLASLGDLAAPATGTVGASEEVGNVLAPDAYLNLAGPLDTLLQSGISSLSGGANSLLNSLFGAVSSVLDPFIEGVLSNGFTVSADAPDNLTNSIAEVLNLVFSL